jgi:hypothetical protein
MVLSQLISAVTNKVRNLTVIGLGKTTRSAKEIAPYGIDCNPVSGMMALYATTGNNSDRVIIGYINTQQLAAAGECRIYWTDADGNEKGKIWGREDGTVEIAGTSGSVNANHAMQWEAANTQLQTSVVTFINAQLLLIEAGIIAGGGTYTPGTMTLDLTTAKATKILIP